MSSLRATPQTGSGSNIEARLGALEAQYKQAIAEIAEMRSRETQKAQFLANISHDLRTPLTAVITHAEILRDGLLGPISDRQLESINGIISGGRQLLAQVGEILTYARGAANQLTLVPASFLIGDVLEQVHSLNESLLARKRLAFHVELEPSLPPIVADREKVTHIVGNLFGNAIDFTPAGGRVRLTGQRRVRAESVEPLVASATTGVGIA